jgi:hypothetical protein
VCVLCVSFYREKGKIEVDPATCQKVWAELQARGDLQSQKANEMLAAVMADSHVFGFVAAGKDQAIVSFRGTHFSPSGYEMWSWLW